MMPPQAGIRSMQTMALVPPVSCALPRQLVVISDGTNMNFSGGVRDSNAVKLLQWLAAHPDTGRLVCYDPGVGHPRTLHSTTRMDRLADRKDRIMGLAFGKGVQENVAELYGWLMRHWQPGDQIFLFGFSRGAFTVRSVAGLLNRYGLLPPQHAEMLQSLISAYFDEPDEAPWHVQLRRRFGCAVPPAWQDGWDGPTTGVPSSRGGGVVDGQLRELLVDPSRREVPVHFIGVWDTVSSVGLPPFDARFTARPDLERKVFVHVRQALALDEYRSAFAHRHYLVAGRPQTHAVFPTRLISANAPVMGTLQQRWYAGDHADVGGGKPRPLSAQSHAPLVWMLGQAQRVGLRPVAAALPCAPANAYPAQAGSVLTDMPIWALTGLWLRDIDSGPGVQPGPDVPLLRAPQGGSAIEPPQPVWTWTMTGTTLLGLALALCLFAIWQRLCLDAAPALDARCAWPFQLGMALPNLAPDSDARALPGLGTMLEFLSVQALLALAVLVLLSAPFTWAFMRFARCWPARHHSDAGWQACNRYGDLLATPAKAVGVAAAGLALQVLGAHMAAAPRADTLFAIVDAVGLGLWRALGWLMKSLGDVLWLGGWALFTLCVLGAVAGVVVALWSSGSAAKAARRP